MQSTPHDPTEPLPSPQEGGDPLISPSPSDLTKQVLSGVQDSVIKRRRKPYRPGTCLEQSVLKLLVFLKRNS